MQHLLLLHGAIGAANQFNGLAEILKTNFVIHTLDFSGHGGKKIPDDFSIQRFANDVLKYLSEKNIVTVDIFGYSMGGYVALYLARHQPGKIGKVFTMATKFDWTPDIAWREVKMLDATKIEEKIPAFAKQLEQRHAPADWKMVLQKTADMMIGLGNDNPLQAEDYKTLQHKILIGIGDKDMMVTLEETIGVYRKLTNGALVVLPNTPHPIEKVDLNRISDEIRQFFLHNP